MLSKNNKIVLVIVIIIGVILVGKYYQQFSIADTSFIFESEDVYAPSVDNITITNGSMVMVATGKTFNLSTNGSIYYISNASSCDIIPNMFYATQPLLDGTHKICKVQYAIINSTAINAKTYFTTYTRDIQIAEVTPQQLCDALTGEYLVSDVGPNMCRCPDNSTWYDNSTEQVCGPIKVPTEQTFLQQYGLSLGIVCVVFPIILWLAWRRKK